MRLQRLEIAGFKSFPDRSELTFEQGVTAIVGPNGCGKSNVVDALTWVLGEQSAKSLRGERMEDIIFGGSDARKPTAAAEVRLKLSGVASRVPFEGGNGHRANGNGHGSNGNGHGDAHALDAVLGDSAAAAAAGAVAIAVEDDTPLLVRDVELMRRLYRSGESEYLIDGETCRLRDVQDLLMDAGLGVKAYAVIEQGKIGQILSARPTDRRQLIEEAAGVTKYKSRRRAAELKLEAAQQNLTRVDDIIYEVEKQRGTLKRQAAKARRYKRLREELRRWEKVQFAARYRALGQAIESARTALAGARERETAAAAHLAELETTLERLRIELMEADGETTAARETAHATEMEIGRLQQQIAFDRQQIAQLTTTVADIEAEVQALDARQEPARLELEARRAASERAMAERDEAAQTLAAEESTYVAAQRKIEGLEADVEAARSEVFAAVNAATALRHAMEHARAARARMAERIAALEVEDRDRTVEADRADADRAAANEGLERARAAMEALRVERGARETELGGARSDRDARAAELRTSERDLAALLARLASLEEVDAARAQYGDGARTILAEAPETLRHMGSVADYLEVDRRYERAVEACLGDWLQHVIVPTHDDAYAGLQLVRERNAGRVGFVVALAREPRAIEAVPEPLADLTSLADVVRVSGPAAPAIAEVLARTFVANDFAGGSAAARALDGLAGVSDGWTIATLDGDVFHTSAVIEGGVPAEARGILATKREIKELRERGDELHAVVDRHREALAALDVTIAAAESAVLTLQSELHGQEKAMVGFELHVRNASDAAERIARKRDQIANEHRAAEEERRNQDARQDEARESIARIEIEQRAADDQLNSAQRRLFDAREAMQLQANRTAEAKAAHAALVERTTALTAEVTRLKEMAAELETRLATRREDLRKSAARRTELQDAVTASEGRLDERVRTFDEQRERVKELEERSMTLRSGFDAQDGLIRDARRALDGVRAEASQLDVARATAEADLTHLAASCVETVQATLDEVAAEVDALERDGLLASPRPVDDRPDAAETDDDAAEAASPAAEPEDQPAQAQTRSMTPDEMVTDLRAKIERMGAVNMMAIDQFDDLEQRHTFLTAQKKDLVEAIASTGEAIRKIDKTTKERFRDAFTVINQNFEQTFTTLFGGGRAGLVLLDEADQLESGIDIIAQPPGKRLQNVQLLSGGEKALTAMALMFAIFKYRPSPFCLLDEIDAPLDDANIGRFVEMLQGMQEHTQFILITHNRKTMEIADRLWGVTMEEPGVSKLISVQLN
ncbi:MAG TPA: chromosome segregation protein SMC [Vicinamibacterales bacterium]|nr:chromosome segregation protein SMC [Vicinamibacterales bacterium]